MIEVAAKGGDLWAALIAGATALVVFWLTAFIGEDHRRSRDAKALAAALAGEVESFKIAIELGIKTTEGLLDLLAKNIVLPKRAIPDPTVTVFAANLGRIGLLGVSIGRDLPFAYHMLHAYRIATSAALSSDDPFEQKSELEVALRMAQNANDVLPTLLTKLQARSRRSWRPFSTEDANKKPADWRVSCFRFGSPGWIRTTECLSQSQVPYHLATGLSRFYFRAVCKA